MSQINKKDIINIAREAGFCVNEDGSQVSTNNSYGILEEELYVFARLVAAEERRTMLKMLDSICLDAINKATT